MKKLKILILVLSLLILITGSVVTVYLISKNSKENSSTATETQEAFEPREMLQSFENFRNMFNTGFSTIFGKVDLVEEHHVEGEKCARLQVDGVTQGAKVYMHMDARRDDMNYNFSDLSMIDYVAFYAFNANEEVSIMNFTIIGEDGNYLLNEYCKLEANTGREFKFKIDRVAAKLKDEKARTFKWLLDKEKGVWFFDNVYVEKAYEPVSVEKREFNTDNLLDFSNLSDTNYVIADNTIKLASRIVKLSISSEQGIVKNGSALKLLLEKIGEPDQDETVQPGEYYAGFSLSSMFNSAFDFQNRLKGKKISIDVYSANSNFSKLIVRFMDASGAIFDKEIILSPNVWETVSVSYEELENSTVRLNTISKVSFFIDYQYHDDANAIYYFDNMRLEA